MHDQQKTGTQSEHRNDPDLMDMGFHSLAPKQPAERPARRVRVGWIVGALATAVLAASIAWTQLVDVSSRPTAVPGKRWAMQIASAGTKPTPALMFGRQAGLHVVTVLPRPENGDAVDVLPAALKDGDVWIISLSASSLDVRTNAPAGELPMSFRAKGHIINMYQTKKRTGVRVW